MNDLLIVSAIMIGAFIIAALLTDDTDDDDQDGGKGIRVNQNEPLYAPVGA